MTIGNGQFKFKFFLIFNTYGAFLRNSKKCRKHYTFYLYYAYLSHQLISMANLHNNCLDLLSCFISFKMFIPLFTYVS